MEDLGSVGECVSRMVTQHPLLHVHPRGTTPAVGRLDEDDWTEESRRERQSVRGNEHWYR